jgi:H+-transporting ATPase
MAENKSAAAPALDTNIETGGFSEKTHDAPATQSTPEAAPKAAAPVDEDEDEDIDALIEDLESQDGHALEEEEEVTQPGGGRVIPEDMLQTDSRVGLTDSEVTTRRRKYGLNQMKEEKENLILKFFGYFVGPIQFVMEVSLIHPQFAHLPPFPINTVASATHYISSTPCDSLY